MLFLVGLYSTKYCDSLVCCRYDLTVARADNEVDMRYMINMAYSTDLPINTMGRRVRTRLYFTSESHLHTMLNVLRFAKDRSTVLSDQGMDILNGTSELCYLTQIVMRLFEDSRWEMDDPRRFRVEILFSPGATATPLHMHEEDRDSDPSRFDTAPLEMIGRDGLTCQELEDFFQAAVMEGATEDELEKHEILTLTDHSLAFKSGMSLGASVGTSTHDEKKTAGDIPSEIPIPPEAVNVVDPVQDKQVMEELKPEPPLMDTDKSVTGEESIATIERRDTEVISNKTAGPLVDPEELVTNDKENIAITEDDNGKGKDTVTEDKEEVEDDSKTIRNLERKYFWSTVAIGSFLLATSCLVLAMNLSNDSRRTRRYNTKR